MSLKRWILLVAVCSGVGRKVMMRGYLQAEAVPRQSCTQAARYTPNRRVFDAF